VENGDPRGSPRPSSASYLDRSSLPSGGKTTRRPLRGMALSSMLKPAPSLWGKAAPILVQRLPALPLLSYSSTVKTLEPNPRRNVGLVRERGWTADCARSSSMLLDVWDFVLRGISRKSGNVRAARANGAWNKSPVDLDSHREREIGNRIAPPALAVTLYIGRTRSSCGERRRRAARC
jgi:hypothetical protein